MTAIRQGQIVWTPVKDNHGNPPKGRPVVVISNDEDNEKESTALAVVLSHSAALQFPLPEECIPLLHHTDGHCVTKLRKETVAVCNWVTPIPSDFDSYDTCDVAGIVPRRLLKEIVLKVVGYMETGMLPGDL